MNKYTWRMERICLIVIVLCVFLRPVAWAETFISTNDFGSTLTGSISSDVCTIGRAVMFDLSLTNNIAGILQTSAEPVFGTFMFAIEDASGETVPMTRLGQQIRLGRAISGGKRRPMRLNKGEGFYTEIELSTLFDLTLQGTYTVKVSTFFVRIEDSQISKGKLELPPLQFEIVSPSHAP